MPQDTTQSSEYAEAPAQQEWHCETADAVLARLGSNTENGLTSARAAELLSEHGLNQLTPPEKTPAWRMFVAQFNDFMIWVLMVAVAISAWEGQIPEAIAITAILILNGVLGFVQEYRAEQALEALKKMSAPVARVVRDGSEREIPAEQLVVGDIVKIEAGDRIPSRVRLSLLAAAP